MYVESDLEHQSELWLALRLVAELVDKDATEVQTAGIALNLV